MQADKYMGFDDYLYIVKAIDDDGTVSEYEYGSKEKACSHFSEEAHAVLYRYRPDNLEVLEEK